VIFPLLKEGWSEHSLLQEVIFFFFRNMVQIVVKTLFGECTE